MRRISFLSRLAFICNILFLFCLVIQHTHDFIQNNTVNGIIIVLGWLLGFFINLLVCCLYLVRTLRKLPLGVRPWLAAANILFLLAQVLIQLILA